MQTNVLLELTLSQSILMAALIPLISTTITIILYLSAQRKGSDRFSRLATIMTNPIKLKPLQFDVDEDSSYLKDYLVNRYTLILLLLSLFFICNFLASFYHLPIHQSRISGSILYIHRQRGQKIQIVILLTFIARAVYKSFRVFN